MVLCFPSGFRGVALEPYIPTAHTMLPPRGTCSLSAAAIPAAATPRPVIRKEQTQRQCLFGRGFPCYSSSPHSRFNNDTHKSEHRCNSRSDVPCLGQLHEVLSGRSVRTEAGKNINAACVAETARSALFTPTTWHQGFDQTYHEAEWKLVLAASRSAQAKSQGAEVLVEASTV